MFSVAILCNSFITIVISFFTWESILIMISYIASWIYFFTCYFFGYFRCMSSNFFYVSISCTCSGWVGGLRLHFAFLSCHTGEFFCVFSLTSLTCPLCIFIRFLLCDWYSHSCQLLSCKGGAGHLNSSGRASLQALDASWVLIWANHWLILILLLQTIPCRHTHLSTLCIPAGPYCVSCNLIDLPGSSGNGGVTGDLAVLPRPTGWREGSPVFSSIIYMNSTAWDVCFFSIVS